MLENLKELWKFRELLLSMVERELRIRYKNSAFGFLWSFLTPLATTAVLTLVFGLFLRNGVNSFSAYVLAALLPFTFFQFAVLDSAQSVLVSLPLVKKIYFPREILPLAGIISNFIHMLLGFVVFFLFLLGVYILHPQQSPFQWTSVYLPLLWIVSFALGTGCGLLVCALNTFYEDVKYIVSVLLYLLLFLTPIMYFSENVAYSPVNMKAGGVLYQLYHLNPLAALATQYRKILLEPPSVLIDGELRPPIPLDPIYTVIAVVFSFFMLWLGYHVFNRMKWRFVERP